MYKMSLEMASLCIRFLLFFLCVLKVDGMSIEMMQPREAIVEGVNATLACTVKGSKLVASIRWFNRTNMVPMMADEGEKVISEEEDDGTFTTRSTYTFLPSKDDNEIRMRCRGKNLLMENRGQESLEASQLLNVHYSPRVTLKPFGFIDLNFSDKVNLTCEFDANPKNMSKILWKKNGKAIKKLSGMDNVLEIEKLQHFHKGNYSCELTNSAGTGISTTNLYIHVIHPPAVRLLISSNLLIEQDNLNVTMECNVISANPHVVIAYKWLFKGQVLYRTCEPFYILTEIDRFDSGNYSCKAQNSHGWGEESNIQQLQIKYLPSPAHLYYYPPIIVKGKIFTLSCDVHDLGNPPATKFNWYHNNNSLESQTNSRIIINSTITKLPLKFSCNVANELGDGLMAFITVPLMTPPVFIQSLPPTYIVAETSIDIRLLCQVECSPRCTIYWLKNGQWIDENNKDYIITEQLVPANEENATLESVVSTIKWNFNHWLDGRLKRRIDDANYTCEPSENLVGRGINSTVLFSVGYAPDNINLSIGDVDVIEGERIENILCNADAEPKETYKWSNGDKVLSATSELIFDGRMSKEMSGIYTCTASNVYGEIEKNITINILHKPQCEISTEVNIIGKVFINCKFSANPTNLTINWKFENKILKNNIISDGLTSTVIFAESPERYGKYECIGINFVGNSTCVTQFTSIK